jgi:hypothetical protein
MYYIVYILPIRYTVTVNPSQLLGSLPRGGMCLSRQLEAPYTTRATDLCGPLTRRAATPTGCGCVA